MVVKFAKVIGSPPINADLEPSTIYFVRAGSGYDQYVSDATGATAHRLNAAGNTGGTGSDNLNVPDRIDDAPQLYFYFGWENVGGSWLVQRQDRATGATQSATSGYVDLDAAWPNRNTLNYA